MVTKTTPPQANAPEQEVQYGPHHHAFSWLHSAEFDPRAELTARTYDVARGIETVLNIVMNAQLHQQSHGDDCTDPDDRPLFSKSDTERLVRLALASAQMLASDADVAITVINRAASREGK